MKAVSGIMLTLLFIGMLTLPFSIQLVECEEPPEIEWSKTYGGIKHDRVEGEVIQTSDGGYATAADTFSFGAGESDFWLVKTDSSGTMQWNQTYGGGSWDYSECVVQTSDGGYAIAGETYSFAVGDCDFWLVKTDPEGNMQWNKTYGGTGYECAHSMVQTGDDGYALAGTTGSFGAGGWDFWLVKTDSSGTMQWNQTYGGTGKEKCLSMVQTRDGGYAMAGYTESFGVVGRDFWLVKTDSSGTMQWNQTYGGTNDEGAESVVQTGDDGYALAGTTDSFVAGDGDVWLVKTDADGNMQWNRTYGGTGHDHAYSVVQTGDGGYTVASRTGSFGAGGYDAWLFRTDSEGNMQWNKTYGGTSDDQAFSMIQTNDGGYCVAGGTKSFGCGTEEDAWLIKLAPVKIPATVDIDPDTLNLKSNGQWITAYITLPEGYNVGDIVLETVYLDGIPAEWSEIQNGVYMVKFDRATVQAAVANEPDYDSAPKFYDLTLTVTGELVDGTPFEGSDAIRVLSK